MVEFDVESNRQNAAVEKAQPTDKGVLELKRQTADYENTLRDPSRENERAAVQLLRDHALGTNALDREQLRALITESDRRQGVGEYPLVPAAEVHGSPGHEHILFRPSHKK